MTEHPAARVHAAADAPADDHPAAPTGAPADATADATADAPADAPATSGPPPPASEWVQEHEPPGTEAERQVQETIRSVSRLEESN